MTAGRRGACKLCEHELSGAINKLILQEWNAAQIKEWAKPLGLTFDRATLYAHKRDHITAPIVTAVQKARANPVIKPKDNREFLEMVRDLAASKLMDNPDAVTVDHGINAVKVMEQRSSGHESIAVLLAKVVTRQIGEPEMAEVVVGEFREISMTEGTQVNE